MQQSPYLETVMCSCVQLHSRISANRCFELSVVTVLINHEPFPSDWLAFLVTSISSACPEISSGKEHDEWPKIISPTPQSILFVFAGSSLKAWILDLARPGWIVNQNQSGKNATYNSFQITLLFLPFEAKLIINYWKTCYWSRYFYWVVYIWNQYLPRNLILLLLTIENNKVKIPRRLTASRVQL